MPDGEYPMRKVFTMKEKYLKAKKRNFKNQSSFWQKRLEGVLGGTVPGTVPPSRVFFKKKEHLIAKKETYKNLFFVF